QGKGFTALHGQRQITHHTLHTGIGLYTQFQTLDTQHGRRCSGLHGGDIFKLAHTLAPPGRRTRKALKRRVRGSNAVCTASAKMFADRTKPSSITKAPARPHQMIGSRDSSLRAASIMRPKDGMLGSTPIPR